MKFIKRQRPAPPVTRAQYEAAIAKAFNESQTHHRPMIENAICGFGEPNAKQIAELMKQGEPSKHPDKKAEAMAIYHAVLDGRLIPGDD